MSIYKQCRCPNPTTCGCPWWASYQEGGLRVRTPLSKVVPYPPHTKRDAQRAFDELKAQVHKKVWKPRIIASKTTLRELLERYAEDYLKPKGISFNDSLRYKVRKLQQALGDHSIASLTAKDVAAYAQSLSEAGLGTVTVNRQLQVLRACYNWAIESGYTATTPFRRGDVKLIRLAPEERRERRLAMGEERALLASCDPDLKDRIVCLLDAGLRRGELLSLQVRDVTPCGDIIVRAAKAKSRRLRIVPTTKRLQRVLARRCAGREPAAYVFGSEKGTRLVTFKRRWQAALRTAGIHDLRLHDLRHEYASRLVAKSVPLTQVMNLLGHANIATTLRYDTQPLEALRTAVRRLG